MDTGVYSIGSISDEKISELIDGRRSFVLEHINRLNMGGAVKTIEKILDAKGLKSRTYTKFRAAAMVGAIHSPNARLPTPADVALKLVGVASIIGIGIHRLATWGPDYEIAKNLATGTLTVTFQKEPKS